MSIERYPGAVVPRFESAQNYWVRASDYDDLAARLAEADRRVNELELAAHLAAADFEEARRVATLCLDNIRSVIPRATSGASARHSENPGHFEEICGCANCGKAEAEHIGRDRKCPTDSATENQ